MLHVYGPHIFHTDDEEMWTYVNRYMEFKPYVNRVKAITQGRVFTLPINLLTINQYFGKTFSPGEAQAFVESQADLSIRDPNTRVTEHKYFAPWESHDSTVCSREFSRRCEPGDIPYYPVHLVHEDSMREQYMARARAERKVAFVGRLGTYCYLDMDVTVRLALDAARTFLRQRPPAH